MTSSQESTDHHRMSADVNNRTSFTAVNNNPSSSVSVGDCVPPLSPIMRASNADQSAAVFANRRSDFADYRGGSSSGTGSVMNMAAGVTSSFRSPKLESQGASGGGMSAKRVRKTPHHASAASSMTGKWRQKMTDVTTAAAGGRLQASDSVRKYFFCGFRLQCCGLKWQCDLHFTCKGTRLPYSRMP